MNNFFLIAADLAGLALIALAIHRFWKAIKLPKVAGSRWLWFWASVQVLLSLAIFLIARDLVTIFLERPEARAAISVLTGAATAIAIDAVTLLIRPPELRRNWLRMRRMIWMFILLVLVGSIYRLWVRAPIPTKFGRVHAVHPVHGKWSVVSGGRLHAINHHRSGPMAEWAAIDLEMEGPPGSSMGQPVYAPVAGRAVRVIDDQSPGGSTPEGNVIVIGNVTLAHLQQGSILVEEGDEVRIGQLVARCGDTGSNVERPHLHIHASLQEEPIPIVFGPKRRHLVRGDIIDSKE